MEKLCSEYLTRPWPTIPISNRRRSKEPNFLRCSTDCGCKSFAQCQQNAMAYSAASKYCNDHPDAVDKNFKASSLKAQTARCHKCGCAALRANHKVTMQLKRRLKSKV